MAQESSFQIVGSKWGSIARVLGGKPQSFALVIAFRVGDARKLDELLPYGVLRTGFPGFIWGTRDGTQE